MSPIKTIIEVRYTHLLDFANIYKPILSPYLKLAEFSLSDIGSLEENVKLTFKEERYSIEVKWDRIIFTCDAKMENLFASNGPLTHFTAILQKLKESSSFGEIKVMLLAQWVLFELDKNQEEVIKYFSDKFLQGNVPIDDETVSDDLGIVVNFKDKDNKHYSGQIHYGIYRKDFDVKAFSLTPINSKTVDTLLDKKGIFSHIAMIHRANIFDMDLLRKMDKKSVGFLRKLNING